MLHMSKYFGLVLTLKEDSSRFVVPVSDQTSPPDDGFVRENSILGDLSLVGLRLSCVTRTSFLVLTLYIFLIYIFTLYVFVYSFVKFV